MGWNLLSWVYQAFELSHLILNHVPPAHHTPSTLHCRDTLPCLPAFAQVSAISTELEPNHPFSAKSTPLAELIPWVPKMPIGMFPVLWLFFTVTISYPLDQPLRQWVHLAGLCPPRAWTHYGHAMFAERTSAWINEHSSPWSSPMFHPKKGN